MILRADLHLQLLEAPEAAVAATFSRIAVEHRQLAVRSIGASAVAQRKFPRWSMRDDPVQGWLWSAAEIGEGAPDRVPPAGVRTVLSRLSASDKA